MTRPTGCPEPPPPRTGDRGGAELSRVRVPAAEPGQGSPLRGGVLRVETAGEGSRRSRGSKHFGVARTPDPHAGNFTPSAVPGSTGQGRGHTPTNRLARAAGGVVIRCVRRESAARASRFQAVIP